MEVTKNPLKEDIIKIAPMVEKIIFAQFRIGFLNPKDMI
jgi:hypothetical protein